MPRTRTLIAGALALAFAGGAHAIPTLQLGILNGSYGSADETVYAPVGTNTFTLYAYLTPGNGAKPADIAQLLGSTYALSMAVTPKTTAAGASLGSFLFGGETINVTADMTYGTPPLEIALGDQSHDPGDLSTHSIFDTHFVERTFKFSAAQQTNPFNTQDEPGKNPLITIGSGMYYVGFSIDVTMLSKAASIHFDLYDTKLADTCKPAKNDKKKDTAPCTASDIDINLFAPYSHDAQSQPGGDGELPPVSVPEPGSLALIGLGLFGLASSLRRRLTAAN